MTNTSISIAVIDNHTLVRSGFAAILTEFEEITVVFQAGNGLEMQQHLKKVIPDIVLMDIHMPGMDGEQATRWLNSHFPQVRVLALSMFEDEGAIIKMIRAGAKGYISKNSTPLELLNAVKTIHLKGIFINDLVSGSLVHLYRGDPASIITEREQLFLVLCCSDLSYREIAEKMFVSPRTVENYRDALFQKFEVKTRTGLALYAIKHRIVEL